MFVQFIGLIAIFSFSTALQAAEFFRGASSSAMGQTGRAGIDSIEAAFLNPAILPRIKNTAMNAYYRDGSLLDAQHTTSMGLGVFDNTEDVYFPGGFHYLRLRETGVAAQPTAGEAWHGAVGYALSDRLSVGLSAYRLSHQVGSDRFVQWNGALGLLLEVTPEILLAYVLDNPAHPGSEIPPRLREETLHSIGFLGSIMDVAKFRADISSQERDNPERKMVYRMGLETQNHEFFIVRVGFKRDQLHDQSLWSAGFCFNGPRLKVDYALEKNPEGASGALHSVDLRLPF